MIQGSIHLTLLMGPVVPVPAPRVVIDALQSVTVTTAAGSASGFQMQFSFNSSSELNTLFVIAPALSSSVATPPLRILLIVTINGLPTPLFDGVMTNVQVQAGQNGSPGTVNVTGDDLTKVMDTQEFDGLPYPAMPIAARVALICAKYAAYGIIPLPIPEIFLDVPIP
ncbi:MAG: hypothetical protein L3J84_11310, partial [Gammaproteobacteria bacterium]|nr:hypothetical protein [Gammaproteobacteria bacterium]